MNAKRLQDVVADFVAATEAAPPALTTDNRFPGLPGNICQQIGDTAFSRADWPGAWAGYTAALRSGEATVEIAKCMLFAARAALYAGEHKTAQSLLASYADCFPADPEGLFYLGKTYQAAHRDFEALGCFNACTMLEPGRPKYLASVAQAAHSLAFQGFGFAADTMPSTYIALARSALEAALAKDPDHADSLVASMMLALDTGEIDKAMAIAKLIVGKEPKLGAGKVSAAITGLALALARGGYLGKLREIEYLKTYPAGRRLLARANALTGTGSKVKPKSAAVTVLAPDRDAGHWTLERLGSGKLAWPRTRPTAATPAESVSIDCDFVVPIRDNSRGELQGLMLKAESLPPHVAGLLVPAPGAMPGSRSRDTAASLVIRKSAWNELVAAYPDAGWVELIDVALDALKLHVVARDASLAGTQWPPTAERLPQPRPRVVVLSRHGPRLVGGGEQFLRIAGQVYGDLQQADVLFAGLTSDWEEAQTRWTDAGERFATGFVYDDVAAFREFCLVNRVDAVHAISGLGEFVLDATAGLNVRVIYGVHFWREFIPARVLSRPYYPDVTLADAKPLPAMQEILQRADFVYVNSDFCADIAREAYAWAPPIIYSVPIAETEAGELASPEPAVWQRDFALLVNARADKGWYLLLDIAERLPQQTFVAIAGQSDREAALADVHRRGLHNVHVIDRTSRMEDLYRAARVVLVPSFSFVETFSRVVIEAGRLSRPVLMADSGNLSYLGAGTGLVLPNDADVWAERVAEIAGDPAAAAAAGAVARSIADRHSVEGLLGQLSRVPLRADRPRILVCVGSGIGNICHTTPMLKKLSRHYGAPIDVLAAGDFAGSSAALAGSPFVGQVFERYEHVAERPYDIVLVSHSFGTLVPGFNAYRVLESRSFAQFDPAAEMHESEFSLAFLKTALGLDYTDAEVRDYFFGGLTDVVPASRNGGPVKIAFHAGSKGGMWAAKRWPGFARLAGELIGSGIEVVSVGITDEYVPGTTDKTGLTIARMAEELSTCDAIVSNDSGVMNIANALGLPTVAIFAPTNPVTRGPLKAAVRILAPATDCSPCEGSKTYGARFAEGKCQCISLISTDKVIEALRDLGVLSAPVSQDHRLTA